MMERLDKIEFIEMFFEGVNTQVEFIAHIVSEGQFYENLIKCLKMREIGKCKNVELKINELHIPARIDMNNVKNNTFNITAKGALKKQDDKGRYITKEGTIVIKKAFIADFVENNLKLNQGQKLLSDIGIVIADTNEISIFSEE